MFRIKSKDGALVSLKSESMCHGMMMWKQGGKIWVVRYPISIVLYVIMFFWIVTHHYLNLGHTSWFTKLFDYTYPMGGSLHAYSIFSHWNQISRVSGALDKWWHYTYLEKELDKLKRNAATKIKRFNFVYYNFMVMGGVSYSLLPFWRYCYNADNDSNSLLLFQCWSPFPLSTWWGFSITYLLELITMVSVFVQFGSIITFLMASVVTIGNHLQLISDALTTTVERAGRAIKEAGIPEDQDWASLRSSIIQKELNNSILHLQNIFIITDEVCEFFTNPISVCYYPAIFTLGLCCEKLATEREDKFLLFQVAFMSAAILLNQYIIAFINQILTDQMENLRLAVYDSRWYSMQVPCRKTIHIMQSMVLKKPTVKTILGARADMEFFAAVCNASYYYLSAMLSMNVHF